MNWLNSNLNLPVQKRMRPELQSRDNLFGLMDDFFKEWGSLRLPDSYERFMPATSVFETANSYVVEAEVPGVKKTDLTVDFQDGTLTIKGEMKSFDEEKKEQYHRFERTHGSFLRTIKFPKDTDPERVSAKMEDGVLRIEIARTSEPEKKKRTIAIV